jgi:hypothetical protein
MCVNILEEHVASRWLAGESSLHIPHFSLALARVRGHYGPLDVGNSLLSHLLPTGDRLATCNLQLATCNLQLARNRPQVGVGSRKPQVARELAKCGGDAALS